MNAKESKRNESRLILYQPTMGDSGVKPGRIQQYELLCKRVPGIQAVLEAAKGQCVRIS